MGPFATGILVPLGLFAMIFGIVYLGVTSRNRERMALIERGADPALFETKKKAKIDYEMLTGFIIANKDKLQYVKSSGKADKDTVSIILEDHGIQIPDTEVIKLIKRGVMRHPDIFKRTEATKNE